MELQQIKATETKHLHDEIFAPALTEKANKTKEQGKNPGIFKNRNEFDRFIEAASDCV